MMNEKKIAKIDSVLEQLLAVLDCCTLCPRNCQVNRHKKKGFCQADSLVYVASHNIHTGEEPPFSGTRGSGTIFFSNCPVRCIFCQNWPISMSGNGKAVSGEELSEMMLTLQKRGAHNINLVTGTHYVPQIIAAYRQALEKGLSIPLLTNCSGYESLEIIKLLDGIIDIYLPDAKYALSAPAASYSNTPDYPEINQQIIREMYRQTGNLVCDDNEIAVSGICVRHLVLPGEVENSKKVLEFLASLDTELHISVMSQFFPAHGALKNKVINRPISVEEYYEVVEYGEDLGLENMFIQELI